MKYVYILSSPHGGSTLLGLVVGGHPDVANLGEVSFMSTSLALGEQCTCLQELSKCEEWAKIFLELKRETGIDMRESPYKFYLGDAIKNQKKDTEKYTGLVDRAHQTLFMRVRTKIRAALDILSLNFPTNKKTVLFTLPTIKKSVENTLQFYKAASTSWHKKVTVDASKFTRKAIRLYLSQPENVRIIHLVRDVRGVVNSHHYTDAKTTAKQWHRYHSLALKWLNKWVDPAHRMHINYEDFANNPQDYAQKICEWLDIPYAEDMCIFKDNTVIHSGPGNPSRFNMSEGIRPADERWRKNLSKSDLVEIDKIAGKLNSSFGYTK